MPTRVATGTPRDEIWGRWLAEVLECHWRRPALTPTLSQKERAICIRSGWLGITTPPGAIRESPLQEILAGVAGAGPPCSESGTCFRANRPCGLPPAHQGMKIGAPVGGFVREAFVPPLRPLDSGPVSAFGACFCGKDEVGSPCGHRWWYRDLRSFAGC